VRNPNDVAIEQLKIKQKLLRESLEQRKQALRPEIEARRRLAILEEIKQKAAEARQQIAQLGEQEKVLAGMVQDEQMAADRIGRASLDIRFLLDDLKRIEQVHDQVVSRLDELRVESKAPGRVTVTAEAGMPLGPHQPLRRYMVATTLGVLGFSLVQFVIFGLAVARPRIGSPEELMMAGHVPVFGTLPRFANRHARRGDPHLPAALPSHREYEAAVDHLRAVLLLDRRRPAGGFTLAVTSAARGEGKSTLASHLAASAARVGQRVLLIDADLDHPTLDKLFSVAGKPGLVQAVRDSSDVNCLIQATSVPGLDLLAAGGRSDCGAVLQDGRFPQIVTQLTGRYDLVVIDTSPVLAAPEALYVGRASDLCLLSVLCDESQQVLVEQAHHRLQEVGVKIRGAVLHATPVAVVSAPRCRWRTGGRPTQSVRDSAGGAAAPLGMN
jgi:tyrosine-protein kinase Etk/Wzc